MTDLLAGARRVLFVHAHPDDETLATGGLIAELVARGVEVSVLTATRGEQGEVVAGPLTPLAGTPALTVHREREVAAACATLGVTNHAFLGTPHRTYTDSGMAWLDEAETVAGPGDAAGPDALTAADPAEVGADIATAARAWQVDAIVSYDAQGGYFHPDHVALHGPSRAAASDLRVPFWEVVSDPGGEGEWHDLAGELPTVVAALQGYGSQLVVEGSDVVHVGGQRQPIQTRIGLRRG